MRGSPHKKRSFPLRIYSVNTVGVEWRRKASDKDVYAYSTTTLSSFELEHEYMQIFKNEMLI